MEGIHVVCLRSRGLTGPERQRIDDYMSRIRIFCRSYAGHSNHPEVLPPEFLLWPLTRNNSQSQGWGGALKLKDTSSRKHHILVSLKILHEDVNRPLCTTYSRPFIVRP